VRSCLSLAPIGGLVGHVQNWDPTGSANGTEIMYIDIAAIDQGLKCVATPTRIKAEHAPSRARQLVEAGDVLVSTVRPNLNAVARVPESLAGATASTGFCVLRPKPGDLDSDYLFHWVRTPQFVGEMVRRATGASYPAVSDGIVKESLLPFPPLPEQQRIAAILDKADAIRRKRQETIALTEELLRSTFLEMFGDPVTNPKGWPVESLGSHLTFVTSGSRGWARHYRPAGTRFIRSFDVQMNRVSNVDAVFVDPPGGAEAERTRVQAGDVLLTITGSRIGRVAPVDDLVGEAFVSQHVAILRPAPSLRPRFLSMFLSEPRGGQHQISRMQYGQTKPGLNLDQVRSFRLPFPPIEAQDRFCHFWTRLEGVLSRSLKASNESDVLFNSLVQHAFRGEL